MVQHNFQSVEDSRELLSSSAVAAAEDGNAVFLPNDGDQRVSVSRLLPGEKLETDAQHSVVDTEPVTSSGITPPSASVGAGEVSLEVDEGAVGIVGHLKIACGDIFNSSMPFSHSASKGASNNLPFSHCGNIGSNEADSSPIHFDSLSSPGCSSPRLADGRGECRICQEEDDVSSLETPCACSGSVKFAHRACVQRWINEKGNIICEICHETYKNGFTAPVRRQLLTPDELPAHIRDEIALPINHRGFMRRDSRIYAVTVGDRQFLEVEYEDDVTANTTGATWCRSAALMLLALLLLRHAFVVAGTGDEEDPGMFTLFVLRVIGILLPCYVMARALNLMQRRQEEEASLMAHAEGSASVALLLQGQRAQSNGLNFFVAAPVVPPLVQNQV